LSPGQILLGFRGRLSRAMLLMWGLPVFAIALLVYAGIERLLAQVIAPPRSEGIAGIAILALGFSPIAPLLVKRLHDFGASGWWLLLAAAPEIANSGALALGLAGSPLGTAIEYLSFAGGAGLAMIAAWPGTRGANRYGPAGTPETGNRQ
jgi:uncharacterized membrane protein YhaH (DUF805 family)